MKRLRLSATAVTLAALALATNVLAAEPYKGDVKKVDAATGKVTLTHGPIEKFGMSESMTMVYRVADPAMLTKLKAGDKITFDTDKINGHFTITRMEKAR